MFFALSIYLELHGVPYNVAACSSLFSSLLWGSLDSADFLFGEFWNRTKSGTTLIESTLNSNHCSMFLGTFHNDHNFIEFVWFTTLVQFVEVEFMQMALRSI